MTPLSPISHGPIEFGLLNPWYWLDADISEKLTMLGALGVLTLLLVAWAVFFRKRRRRRSHRDYPSTQARLRPAQGYGARERKRRRSSRPVPRPRNPTLAEARGLPPIRPQEPQETAG